MLRPILASATLAGSLATAPMPAFANDFEPVSDLTEFLSLIEGRELRLGLFGVALKVMSDGRIDGTALGDPVTGSWSWEDGFFCRELDWGGTPIPYNCQLVEVRGNAVVRFTVDQGAGDSAQFNLR
jgi:hypothetical protein